MVFNQGSAVLVISLSECTCILLDQERSYFWKCLIIYSNIHCTHPIAQFRSCILLRSQLLTFISKLLPSELKIQKRYQQCLLRIPAIHKTQNTPVFYTLSQIYHHWIWNSKLNTKFRLEFQFEYGLKLELGECISFNFSISKDMVRFFQDFRVESFFFWGL